MEGTAHIAKYAIVQRLGTGGMAEVFKCRLVGVGGFEKDVVVKRMLPHLLEDAGFVSMFLDEARIAANLAHPNIVQVYEIAQDDDGTPFIAMEYVRGPTLSQLVRKALKSKDLSFSRMARLIAGAAMGLDYAHNARGPDGQPLNIVHRDISPQNIIVSLDGTAKILDFGVAKAEGRLTHTQGGVIKGKLRFMAPEQLSDPSGQLDRRADVFSLGVCLYAATTGHLPFSGANDVEIMRRIAEGLYQPPSELFANYPPELEAIVARALRVDRDERYPTCKALADDLTRWVASVPGGLEENLPAWLEQLFPEIDIESWGGGQTPSGLRGISGLSGPSGSRSGLGSRLATPMGTLPHRTGVRSGAHRIQLPSPQPTDAEPEIEIDLTGALPPSAAPAPRSKVALAGAGLAGLALLAGGVVLLARREPPPVAAPPPAPAAAAPAATESIEPYLDECRRLLHEGKLTRAKEQLERARRRGRLSAGDDVRLTGLESELGLALHLDAAARAVAEGKLDEARAQLESVGADDPTNARAAELRELIAGKQAALDAPSQPVASARPGRPAKAARSTPLSVTSEPPGATVYVDGNPAGTTPLAHLPLAPGAHTIEARKAGLQTATEAVNATGSPLAVRLVLAGQKVAAPEPAPRAPPAVEAKPRLVVTSTVRARVSVDGAVVGETPFETEALVPGRHTLTVSAEGHQSATRELMLAAGERQSAAFDLQRVPEVKADAPPAPAPRAPQPPALPRTSVARTVQDLASSFRGVERELSLKGGFEPPRVRGTTSALGEALAQSTGAGQTTEVYPLGMYWFIAHGLQAGKSPAQIGRELKSAHFAGDLEHLSQ